MPRILWTPGSSIVRAPPELDRTGLCTPRYRPPPRRTVRCRWHCPYPGTKPRSLIAVRQFVPKTSLIGKCGLRGPLYRPPPIGTCDVLMLRSYTLRSNCEVLSMSGTSRKRKSEGIWGHASGDPRGSGNMYCDRNGSPRRSVSTHFGDPRGSGNMHVSQSTQVSLRKVLVRRACRCSSDDRPSHCAS